jgi:hypothetical protein
MICFNCNSENNPDYRFCGMCGASLPAAASERVNSSDPSPSPSVTGPSFLGLAEPAREAGYGYLLEDEPRPVNGLVYLALVLLLSTGAILAWHWRNEGYAWRALMAGRRMLGTAATPAGTGPGTTAPAAEPKAAPPEPSSAPSITANNGGQPSPANNAGQPSSPVPGAGETAASVSPAEPPTYAESRKLKRGSSPDLAEARPIEQPRTAASIQPEDKPAAEYETLAYGNCDHARTNLFAAAEQGNPEAESVLGTMFATGHCVALDLPTAYHWLSRAARQDPANPRIASNLRIVWREMTAAEQQQAAARDPR